MRSSRSKDGHALHGSRARKSHDAAPLAEAPEAAEAPDLEANRAPSFPDRDVDVAAAAAGAPEVPDTAEAAAPSSTRRPISGFAPRRRGASELLGIDDLGEGDDEGGGDKDHEEADEPGAHAGAASREAVQPPERTLVAPVAEARVPTRCVPRAEGGVLAIARDLLHGLGRSRTLGTAAEMAFWLFLSLLPLAAVAGLVTARLAFQAEGASTILESLPPGTREMLTNELGRVSAWNGGAVGVISALTFVWLASSGVHAVFDGLEAETESTSQRSWFKKRFLAAGSCVALSIGVAIIAALSAGMAVLARFVGSNELVQGAAGSALATVLRWAFALVVAVALVVGVYRVGIPARARAHMPLVPGALLAVGLQTGLGLGYRLYLSAIGDGGAYQAGLATIGVTLMALYLLSLSVLAGAELNQLLGERREAH